MRKHFLVLVIVFFIINFLPARNIDFSTAGFYELDSSGRNVYGMNIGWRFHKGSLSNAYQANYDDSLWERVNLPHGLELLPVEASGGINYQGEAWYRKHFDVDAALKGKKIFLHFEAIMGKSRLWVNGQLVKEHFGGFLPLVADITSYLKYGETNVVAICADNSDDPMYPPGKPQNALDFAYFGGIYRDCFLVTHNQVYITDPNAENVVAGGGLFVHYPFVSDSKAIVSTGVHLRNDLSAPFHGKITIRLKDKSGQLISQTSKTVHVKALEAGSTNLEMSVLEPHLWSPDVPYLYKLEVSIFDNKGHIIDGYVQRIGIRSIEFKGKDGFWLNGKPYEDKLIGVNRHQDFAIIGNALPNSLHWRDAKKMRDAGMRIIRCAHYPQDPAFMDACDELGLFVIVTTPGWQFWNHDPLFGQRIYSDIRNMVRRDRNHPSTFFWEPVLNETQFPQDFAFNAKRCIEEEYPYSGGNYTACDPGSEGSELYPLIYTHPLTSNNNQNNSVNTSRIDSSKVYFTREFGDNVDDWASHNSTSRVHRSWGEYPMLVQAHHYANPPFKFTCLEALYASGKYHLGGTLWHSFDHQRGYHPQTFYGGIMDAFRQPKTSYYMFHSQRPSVVNEQLPAESGPMIYVAHEMSPFSSKDITVFSNCEEVHLTVFEGGKQYKYLRSSSDLKMPSPIITFRDAFDFMELKALSRGGKQDHVYILAEGLIGGKIVATHKQIPSRRPTKLRLRLDNEGMALKADGSDIVLVIAEVVDDNGAVKRLNDFSVKFTVDGEAQALGNAQLGSNPVKVQWGTAPLLIRSTTKAGLVKITAEVLGQGLNSVSGGELTFETQAPLQNFLCKKEELADIDSTVDPVSINSSESDQLIILKKQVESLTRKLNEIQLKEVEKQQDLFGEPN